MTAPRPTQILPVDVAGIERAASILRAGGLVVFPTETVYGLGAHALDEAAVHRIFEAKGRPADDPLIVHILNLGQLGRVARPATGVALLAERFWPGPLTLVLPKLPEVPLAVTAGLSTVAVRVPAHPVAQGLLAAADLPIAAPSANLFSRPSPTRVEHVLEDLAGRVDAVLDGGPTRVGVESTIIDLSGDAPRLLRPGGLPAEAIEAVLGVRLLPPPSSGAARAPGLMPIHYAPRTPLTLIAGPPATARQRLWAEVDRARGTGQRVGVLVLDEDRACAASDVLTEPVGSWADPAASATRLFDALRTLDRQNLDVLFARELADPATGLGRALADRLRRASQQVIQS